jgi:hypothetical protein
LRFGARGDAAFAEAARAGHELMIEDAATVAFEAFAPRPEPTETP